MSHTEWQFYDDKALDHAENFARAHVQRALTEEYVEHYSMVVQSILQERRLREIVKNSKTW